MITLHTASLLDSMRKRWKRTGAVALATVAAAGALTGCGSSNNSSSIAPGNESSKAAAEAAKLEREEAKSSTASQTPSAVTTPTSGPLAKEPTVTPPTGPAPSKLQTKEIIKGTGPEAKTGDRVTVNYVGVLYKNGKEFDASWRRNEPYSFALGRGEVIAGWDKGVAGMRVGGRRELIIPADEAYGSRASASIPANSPLVFVVDLLAV